MTLDWFFLVTLAVSGVADSLGIVIGYSILSQAATHRERVPYFYHWNYCDTTVYLSISCSGATANSEEDQ